MPSSRSWGWPDFGRRGDEVYAFSFPPRGDILPAVPRFMAYLLVHHKVTNFERWEIAYDDHRDARKLAGLKELYLLRNRIDPNDIVVLFETDNPERTRTFIWSDELRKVMHEAGVIGTSEMLELDKRFPTPSTGF